MTKLRAVAEPRRKGARRISEIPPDVLEALNTGQTETVNLVEWLAVDRMVLLETVLPKLGLRAALRPALAEIAKLPKPTPTKISPAVGAALLTTLRGNQPLAGATVANLSPAVAEELGLEPRGHEDACEDAAHVSAVVSVVEQADVELR